MSAPKAKTLQERFGFLDPDIKKPEHDKMILWIERNIADILMLVLNLDRPPTIEKTLWEQVIRLNNKGGFQLGFCDLSVKYSIRGYEQKMVLFEAKTAIDTLGELFRQVRMYQDGFIDSSSVEGMDFVIVCPDDSHEKTLRSQGLQFLKYDPNMSFTFLPI